MQQKYIFTLALDSRIILITLQCLSNLAIPDFKPEVFHYARNNETLNVADQLTNKLLGGFLRWDAQYFMHIAKYGYSYENSLAFFPLYPICTGWIALFLNLIVPGLNIDSLLLITFTVCNVIFFILSAACLYELSLLVLHKNLAFMATILYCYNPASVFFSAPYTECVFSYLTFKSMLNSIRLYKKYSAVTSYLQVQDFVYIIPVCLSTIARSNGVLNIGFLVYAIVCLYLKKLKHTKLWTKICISVKYFSLIVITIILGLTPFALFQFYSYKMFCTDFDTNLPGVVVEHAKLHNYVLPGNFSHYHQSWCFSSLPLSYSYVQSHYWNVGFLKYYELKQLPNFLLALPLVFVIISGGGKFLKQFPKHVNKIFCYDLLDDGRTKNDKFNPAMLVFVVHALFLTIFCVLNIHVQVTSRMLCSASPVLYWFSASYISSKHVGNNVFKRLFQSDLDTKSLFVLLYFFGYFVVGTIMFCNYLPWT